jgi:rod shape-determining protein MreD
MIMPRGSDQLLLPVNPFFIGLSLLLAFAFNLLPLGRMPAMPDPLAVALVFWGVHQPRRVGVGLAFFFGLMMDVHQGALLGQRLLWFGVLEQTLQIAPIFFAAHAVALAVRLLAGDSFPGWWLLLAPVFEALLWPLATLLLLAPQRRAPDPDQNRPL